MLQLVLVTHPAYEQAQALVSTLVEERLVACGNILPSIRSIYAWEGKIETSNECLILLKTEGAALARLEARVLELHPYDVPEFVAIEASHVAEKYAAWAASSIAEQK